MVYVFLIVVVLIFASFSFGYVAGEHDGFGKGYDAAEEFWKKKLEKTS